MHTRQKMAGCSFSHVLAPHIPQLWHMHAIAQAALRYLLSRRIEILHTASPSPSLTFEWLCPSTGISCRRVPWIQDQLPSLWDKIRLLSALHSMIGAAPPKPKSWNPFKPSPFITTVISGSKKDPVSFLVPSGQAVCFWHTSSFSTRAGVEGEQKT